MYCFGSTYTKIGTIQRRLAWPLRKDDTQNREAFHIFCPHYIDLSFCKIIFAISPLDFARFAIFCNEICSLLLIGQIAGSSYGGVLSFFQLSKLITAPSVGYLLGPQNVLFLRKFFCCKNNKIVTFFRPHYLRANFISSEVFIFLVGSLYKFYLAIYFAGFYYMLARIAGT